MTTIANWYHAHQDSVKRSEGKSAVGLVSYITGETLKDERTGTWCARNHPGDVLDWGTTAPNNAPAYFTDKAQLSKTWNDIERSETRVNSIVGVHWNVAGSREHSEADHRIIAREIAQALTDRYGVATTYGIHKPTDHGDDRNWHYHFGHNMRRIGPAGIGEKAREIIDQKTFVGETLAIREMTERVINKHLERIGSNERVSHLSYAKRGIVQEPTRHLGNKRNMAELKGMTTEVGDFNRAAKARNKAYSSDQEKLGNAKAGLEAEIHDIRIERLKRMRQGEHKVEIPQNQLDQNPKDQQALLDEIAKQRESIAAFEKEREEEVKRASRAPGQRDEEIQARANRGETVDAEDRWSKAVHESYNARVKPEESMAAAVTREAEMFRTSQDAYREREREEPDAAKKQIIRYDRQIEACEYMAIGADRCADLAGFVVGKKDNEISNRDHERAKEWRSVSDKLHQQRDELQGSIDKGVYAEIDQFLKGIEGGGLGAQKLSPWSKQPSDKPEKDQSFGQTVETQPGFDERPVFRRDQPAAQWRDLGSDEIMPDGAIYRTPVAGHPQVRIEQPQQPEAEPMRPAATAREEKEAREEQTDGKAETKNREDTTFDQDVAAAYREAEASTGRSMGGGRDR